MRRPTIAITLALAMGAPASAEWTVGQVLDAKGSAEALVYVQGLIDGLGWAEVAMTASGGKRLYCVPENLPLTAEQAFVMLERSASLERSFSSMHAGHGMLKAMQTSFPCQR